MQSILFMTVHLVRKQFIACFESGKTFCSLVYSKAHLNRLSSLCPFGFVGSLSRAPRPLEHLHVDITREYTYNRCFEHLIAIHYRALAL